jgi:photosystem II stability/assembly factor-like uncharacterized protein
VYATPTQATLVPNAIAFRDARHGVLGTGFSRGTISLTTDGGRTWRVVVRTSRPVTEVSDVAGAARATLDDGENLVSTDDGATWRPGVAIPPAIAPCPYAQFSDVVGRWALCAGQGGAGNEPKAVYRLDRSRWRRIAWAPLVGSGEGHGGISSAGYPNGMAMADNGFGLIWESRGTLYVTRDGGSTWTGLPRLARPEVDSGVAGAALAHGVGFVVLGSGSGFKLRRLEETRDAGRTWLVVHRWN